MIPISNFSKVKYMVLSNDLRWRDRRVMRFKREHLSFSASDVGRMISLPAMYSISSQKYIQECGLLCPSLTESRSCSISALPRLPGQSN
jgi:hypothetical protein